MSVGVVKHRSLRCSWCDRAWPAHVDYRTCPLCEEATMDSITPPMEEADAHCFLTEGRFSWWLWHNERL